ncbi:SAM-dependent methyltransferase [Alcaligenaceae bacterium]|nr:SAM-dependent methyltransferase [Alcaligenaceae bacterium]
MKPASSIPTGLPTPDAEAQAHQQAVEHYLTQQIQTSASAFLPFEQWMDLALYAPGLGYYAAGSTKFGSALPTGDFTTAPELTPLFAQTLARQVAQVLQASDTCTVLEFGAGSGAMAAAMIPALRELGLQPVYQILEVSGDLQQRQRQRLASFGDAVQWLTSLPKEFAGCILANEVLDAMPTMLFSWNEQGELQELGVRLAPTDASDVTASPFEFAQRLATSQLHDIVAQRMPPLPGYQSELNLRAEAWIKEMGTWLKRGAALLIDYGFPQHEYYHPQRAEGTLMCHYRHHAHAQPLLYAGLQDITAHVDFTAMADAALEGGLDVLGYTSQARFLMNAGLPELLTSEPQTLSAVQKLLSEAEMGELFKVLAIGRGINQPLLGFIRGDRRDRL